MQNRQPLKIMQLKQGKFLASIPEIIETFLDSSAFASLRGVTSLHTNCCVHATPPKVTL